MPARGEGTAMAARKRILLADDVELFLKLESTFFNRNEFDLMTARSGHEALRIVQNAEPELVFMDLYMPDMDGDECCRQIKGSERLRHITVIMVTHGGRESDLVRCRQAGCDGIVFKPINRRDFLDTVQKFLPVEERLTPRYEARLRVQYGENSQQLLTDYSINLSTGGLFIETENPLPVDTPLTVDFILPVNNRQIRCAARVAWVNHPELLRKTDLPSGMGLQFLDITMDAMNAIREYIRSEKLTPFW
jgi:uncharacterized protein (TIGR02266 family)